MRQLNKFVVKPQKTKKKDEKNNFESRLSGLCP